MQADRLVIGGYRVLLTIASVVIEICTSARVNRGFSKPLKQKLFKDHTCSRESVLLFSVWVSPAPFPRCRARSGSDLLDPACMTPAFRHKQVMRHNTFITNTNARPQALHSRSQSWEPIKLRSGSSLERLA